MKPQAMVVIGIILFSLSASFMGVSGWQLFVAPQVVPMEEAHRFGAVILCLVPLNLLGVLVMVRYRKY